MEHTKGTHTFRRKPRMVRVRGESPLRLSASQREVLALLHEYRFLTVRLLSCAYGMQKDRDGRGYWHLHRELRRLFDAGLVERFPASATPVRGGSAETVYTITHRGARHVLDAIEYADARRELYAREQKHRANFAHHLAVATLQLVLTLGHAWWALAEFRAEDRDPSACVRIRVKDRTLTAWPDASAVIETDKGKVRRKYLFEIDLTRKSNERLTDRFLAYAGYVMALQRSATAPRFDEYFVVFVVPSEREVQRFIGLAIAALNNARLGTMPKFLFWSLEDWYTRPSNTDPVPRLLDPREIAGNYVLSTLAGKPAYLVEFRRSG